MKTTKTATTALDLNPSEPLVVYRTLLAELRKINIRCPPYNRLLALVASGVIPSYLDCNRLCRGLPTRCYRLSEVRDALLRNIRRAA